MIHYQTDEYFISATSVEATFSDGITLQDPDVKVTIHTGTPLGDEIRIHFYTPTFQPQNDDESAIATITSVAATAPSSSSNITTSSSSSNSGNIRRIRLVFIPPDKDWRQSASYSWKLDNAWMSADITSPESSFSWLHWNVESYIDSVVQVDDSNRLWECDELELHFRPIREAGVSRLSYKEVVPVTPKERVILRGLRLGLHLSAPVNESTAIISPCSSLHSRTCVVMDGTVQGITQVQDGLPLGTVTATVVATLALLAWTADCCRRYHRSKLYERLRPSPSEDLTLQEYDSCEDSYQNTIRS